MKWAHRGLVDLARVGGRRRTSCETRIVACARARRRRKPRVVYDGKGRGFVDRRIDRERGTRTRSRCSTRRATAPSRTVGLRPDRRDPRPGFGRRRPPSAGRRVVGGEGRPLLQRPALARQGEAPDDVGPVAEARAEAAVDVRRRSSGASSTAGTRRTSGRRSGRRRTRATASSSARSSSSSSGAEPAWPLRPRVGGSAQTRRNGHLAVRRPSL